MLTGCTVPYTCFLRLLRQESSMCFCLTAIGVAGLFQNSRLRISPLNQPQPHLLDTGQTEWLRAEISRRTRSATVQGDTELGVQGRPTPRLGLMHPSVSTTSPRRSSSILRVPILVIGKATGLGKLVTPPDHRRHRN